MSTTAVRAALPRCSAQSPTGGPQPQAAGRQAGEVVPVPSPATTRPPPPWTIRTLSLNARLWANPDLELPVMPGAAGWDVGAA